MRNERILILVIGLLLPGFEALASQPLANDITIVNNNQTGTQDCKGGNAMLAGNDSTLTFKNCKKVSIAGNQNKITLEMCPTVDVAGNQNTISAGPVKSINVAGNENVLSYEVRPKGKKPSISNTGHRNQIKPK